MNKDNVAEKIIEEISYTQFYELPYNPLNKMQEVIGIQESGTKMVARAFDMQGFISQTLTSHRRSLKEELMKKLPRECEFDCKEIINQVLKEE